MMMTRMAVFEGRGSYDGSGVSLIQGGVEVPGSGGHKDHRPGRSGGRHRRHPARDHSALSVRLTLRYQVPRLLPQGGCGELSEVGVVEGVKWEWSSGDLSLCVCVPAGHETMDHHGTSWRRISFRSGKWVGG